MERNISAIRDPRPKMGEVAGDIRVIMEPIDHEQRYLALPGNLIGRRPDDLNDVVQTGWLRDWP